MTDGQAIVNALNERLHSADQLFNQIVEVRKFLDSTAELPEGALAQLGVRKCRADDVMVMLRG